MKNISQSMHENILSKDQKKLLPLLKEFSSEYGLVGGTAIAMQIGHRRSIYFDFTNTQNVESKKINDVIRNQYRIEKTIVDSKKELTIIVSKEKSLSLNTPSKLNLMYNLEILSRCQTF